MQELKRTGRVGELRIETEGLPYDTGQLLNSEVKIYVSNTKFTGN